jgi:hypothetical protein
MAHSIVSGYVRRSDIQGAEAMLSSLINESDASVNSKILNDLLGGYVSTGDFRSFEQLLPLLSLIKPEYKMDTFTVNHSLRYLAKSHTLTDALHFYEQQLGTAAV